MWFYVARDLYLMGEAVWLIYMAYLYDTASGVTCDGHGCSGYW